MDVVGYRVPRDFVEVRGPDAVPWLQGQLSQDVAALGDGASAWSFLLQPQGKVDALVRVTRLADDRLVLDVDGGFGERVIERLSRFRLRVKAELGPLAWACLALRGDGAEEAAASVTGQAAILAVPAWTPGADLVGEAPPVPAGVELLGAEEWEAARIEHGWPAMGAELDDRTIPEEAGIVDRTVSFTKGCYTGQELVARIDSRGGNVARRLRAVVVEGGDPPPRGARIVAGEREVGVLTSVALRRGGAAGLAYVKRDVIPPAEVTLTWDGGSAAGRVEPLPTVR